MSRIIKFRVWDTKLQKMMGWNPFIRFDDSDYVVQQFTGLFDSAEKEIYEGDVLKVPNRDTLYKVVYYEYIASFQFLPIDYDVDVMTFRMCTNYNNYIANMRMTETYSIIGNIFENPELLAAV